MSHGFGAHYTGTHLLEHLLKRSLGEGKHGLGTVDIGGENGEWFVGCGVDGLACSGRLCARFVFSLSENVDAIEVAVDVEAIDLRKHRPFPVGHLP